MIEKNKIIIFQEKNIRRVWHNEEWYYSVLDVIAVLTESPNPTEYFKKMRKRDEVLKNYVGTNCPHVAMEGESGKERKTLAANMESMFRIIQSIPSPKAEPFKLWLARIGKERIDEIENPELAAERAREIYRAKGYPEDWIEMRMQSINVRNELTNEWKGRGVKEGQEYAILTAEISKATFGITPSQHKEVKSLERQNLRDHMTNLELIFTMLGEEMTKQVAVQEDAQGFDENKTAARKGGKAAGDARRAAEQKSGVKVVSGHNFLPLEETNKEHNNLLEPPKE
jgi:hypothetical protein